MDVISGIAVFFVIWWTAIFVVLPWGLKRDERGIPVDAHIGRTLIITTVISIVVWLGVYAAVQAQLIDFRGMAAQMMQEDTQK